MPEVIRLDTLRYMLRQNTPDDVVLRNARKLKVVCKPWYKVVVELFADAHWLGPYTAAADACGLELRELSRMSNQTLTAEHITLIARSMTCFGSMETVQSPACMMLAYFHCPDDLLEHMRAAGVMDLVCTAVRTNAPQSVVALALKALFLSCTREFVGGTALAENLPVLEIALARRPLQYRLSREFFFLLTDTGVDTEATFVAMSKDGFIASVVPHIEQLQYGTDCFEMQTHEYMLVAGFKFLGLFSNARHGEGNRARVCDEGGLRLVKAAIQDSHSDFVQRAGVKLLDTLLSSERETENRDMAERITASGCMPALASLAALPAHWTRLDWLVTVRHVQCKCASLLV